MWHTNQQHLGKFRQRLICLPLRKPFFYVYFWQRSLKSRGSIFLRSTRKTCRRQRPNKPSKTASQRQRWCVCLSLKEVRGVGWELVVEEGEGCIVNQAALPKVGTCKSGERRAGTRPNDSSTALYKYRRAGSTRLLLLVSKTPWDTGVSPSWRKVFNSLLIVFQSPPDLKANHRSLASIKWWRAPHWIRARRVIEFKADTTCWI